MLDIVLAKLFENKRLPVSSSPYHIGLHYRDIEIEFKKGKKLRGWLTERNRKLATVIMVHGWGASSEVLLPLLSGIKGLEANFLLFDARNHGRSDRALPVSIRTFAEDISLVLDFLTSNYFIGPYLLVGHSMGGASSLLVASSDERVKAVASLASFADLEEIVRRRLERYSLPSKIEDFIVRSIERGLKASFKELSPVNTIKKIQVPVLVVHGTEDETVLVKDAYRLKNGGPHVELFIADGVDHMSILQDRRVHTKLSEFLGRFL